jgi:hypothetical protein
LTKQKALGIFAKNLGFSFIRQHFVPVRYFKSASEETLSVILQILLTVASAIAKEF